MHPNYMCIFLHTIFHTTAHYLHVLSRYADSGTTVGSFLSRLQYRECHKILNKWKSCAITLNMFASSRGLSSLDSIQYSLDESGQVPSLAIGRLLCSLEADFEFSWAHHMMSMMMDPTRFACFKKLFSFVSKLENQYHIVTSLFREHLISLSLWEFMISPIRYIYTCITEFVSCRSMFTD